MKKWLIIVLGILALMIIGVFIGINSIKNGKGIIKPRDLTQVTFFELTESNSDDSLLGFSFIFACDPDFSPDANRIVFEKVDSDEQGLYIINSDGTELTELSINKNLYDPSWSPVDNKIVAVKRDGTGLFLINLDKEETQLTDQRTILPSWSPDGIKIAYTVYDDTNAPIPMSDSACDGTGVKGSIWVMNSDGTAKKQLTTNEDGYCTSPSFSPDGSKIVYIKGFVSYMPGGENTKKEPNEIWIMNSDGSDKHRIYAPGDVSLTLFQDAWSENDKILFNKELYQRVPQLWIMNADGTNPRCLLGPTDIGFMLGFNKDIYGEATWDSTGTKITFTKYAITGEQGVVSSMEGNIVTVPWKK